MNSAIEKKIIARLAAAKADWDKYPAAEAEAEFTAAWDAAGAIWEAALTAKGFSSREQERLWGLLAPYDDEASSRRLALIPF